MERRHKEGRDPNFYSAMTILVERYKKHSDKIICIMERMRCLFQIQKDERMRGWSIESIREDCLLTNGAVFTAVALCPLRQIDEKRLYFDPR